MNIKHQTASEARAGVFCSIVLREGQIKRGVITSRMHVSSHTFASEYKDYLEQYPNIHYNKETREFKYKP